MSKEQWTAIDKYITDHLPASDAALTSALETALADSKAANLPTINVSPIAGKLLMILARMCRAKNILEIGTLGGYSTICLASGLAPGGRLITLEMSEKHAAVARKNIDRAGFAKAVEIRLGKAIDSLPRLLAEKRGPFDLVFIDADKASTPEYFDWAIRLSQPGSTIIVDNVVRKGEVANPQTTDTDAQGIRRFYDALAREKRVTATAFQTVGVKGHDGLAIAIVN